MRKKLYQILKEVSEFTPASDRHLFLRQSGSVAIKEILRYAFDKNINFVLPKGEPPFKPFEGYDAEGRLYSEIRRLYLFVEGGNPNLKPVRREFLFIQLLESIDSEDAKLLLAVKEKKLPFKGITEKTVRQAFPDLLPLEGNDEQNIT